MDRRSCLIRQLGCPVWQMWAGSAGMLHLNEFLQRVERGEIPARHWLGAANQVLKLTTDHRARKIAGQTSNQLAGNSAVECHRQKPGRKNQAVSGTAIGTGLQKIQGHFHLTNRRFDWPACFQVFSNRPDKSPHGTRTYPAPHSTDVLKSRSIPSSPVQATPDRLHSASDFRTARSVRKVSTMLK